MLICRPGRKTCSGKDRYNCFGASFFISRIDSMVDKELDKKEDKDLKGKIAVANAKLVYQKGKELFSSERFKKLQKNGAKIQRLLWASTSTKNPAYPDTLYVEELIGKNTINTSSRLQLMLIKITANRQTESNQV
jgi:transaldolase